MHQFWYFVHFKSVGHPYYMSMNHESENRLIWAKLQKIDFSEKFPFQNENFLKMKKNETCEDYFTTKQFQIIVSSVRIKITLILNLHSNLQLSIKGFKNDSQCLDTL